MKELILEAFDLKNRGYYKQAIEVYYKLFAKDGDNVEVLAELADLYLKLNNTERALHYVNKVFEKEPNNITGLNIAIKIFETEGDFKRAEELSRKILEQNGNMKLLLNLLFKQKKYEEIITLTEHSEETFYLYLRAQTLAKLNRNNEALDILKQIQTLPDFDPDEYENILELTGRTYLEQNKVEEAKEVFKKLEENNSQTPEGLNLVGLEKLDSLKLDEAITYFAKALEQDEKNAQYHYNMGQAYFLKGWFEEAQNCFNTAMCLNPNEEKYHYSLGYLYYRIENFELAEAHLNPEYLDSKILLQVIKSEKGNLASPKVELEKLQKEHPENERILYSLAKIYYNLDMYKQAKTMIEETIKVNPKPFEYQTFDVRLMLKLNMLENAETKIKELIEKYPNYYYAKVLEGELYLAKKEYDLLFDTAQELIELDMNHYEGYYFNALSLFEKDDINFAIESLKKAISLDVNNADLYVKMSEFYQAIGKYEDAFAYIKEASDIDKSASNQELYMQLAGILRHKGAAEKQ